MSGKKVRADLRRLVSVDRYLRVREKPLNGVIKIDKDRRSVPPRRIRKCAVCLSVPESINVRKYVSEIISTPYLDYWASN